MRFTPKSAKEIAEEGLLPPGEYDFEVFKAVETVSKSSGADMIRLTLKVYETADGGPLVDDFLLESFPRKLRNFCVETGLLGKYDSGTLTADDCIGRSGKVQIIIQKDKEGKYPDKNSVKDYGPKKAQEPMLPVRPAQAGPPAQTRPQPEPETSPLLDNDDVPF